MGGGGGGLLFFGGSNGRGGGWIGLAVYVAEIAGGIDDVADELFEVFDFCLEGTGLEFLVL